MGSTKNLFHTLAAAALLAVGFTQANAAAPTYTITDLGALNANVSYGQGISANGKVVGYSLLTSGNVRGFLYNNAPIVELPPLSGLVHSIASGVNDSGQVAGYASDALARSTGVLWTNNVPTAVKGNFNSQISVLYGINNSGQAVGEAWGQFQHSAFIYKNGQYTELNILPGGFTASGRAINDAGQVAGHADNANFAEEATIWTNNVPKALGLMGGDNSYATAISSNGSAAGYWEDADGVKHAFVWKSNAVTPINRVMGDENQANGVNASGIVVGEERDTVDGGAIAFVWKDGVTYDLNTCLTNGTGWQLQGALAINDAGQVTGYGLINFQLHAFLLKPGTSTPSIPGDIDQNGCVNDIDLFLLTQDFLSAPGSASGNPRTDIDGNGAVDDFDLFTLTQHFLDGC